MEEERFVFTRENPRNLGFLQEHGSSTSSSSNKAMPSDPVQKPAPPILDRFRALLKEREEELRVSDDDDVPAPGIEEIVQLYEVVLSELIFNSKPIITELTIIAGEHREYGEGIADVICDRIIEAPVDQKLPSLYLLDSIVKNIGRDYVKHFASRLPEVFCEAYKQVHPSQYPAMRHLFGTWSAVFPPSVLRKIEAELQFSPPVNHNSSGLTSLRASESPRPTHGIHVNPKYLEARHQFERSTMMHETDSNIDAVRMTAFGGERMERNAFTSPKGWSGASPKFHDIGRGISSGVKLYGQKPAVEYDDYDIDHAEVISSQVGARRLGSPGSAAHATSVSGAEKNLLPSSKTRLASPSSPSRVVLKRSLSPPIDEFVMDNFPRRVVKKASPSHSGFDYGIGKVAHRDGERSDWQTKHRFDGTRQQLEPNTVYNLSNESDRQRPKALIDAYGNDRGKNSLKDKRLKVERLDVNTINSKAATRWQNTEEEEYIWEDMSPTLADRSRSNGLMALDGPPGSLSTRNGSGLSAAFLESNFNRGDFPSQAQLSAVNGYAEDGVSILGPRHGSLSKIPLSAPGSRNETTQIPGSRYPEEPWNFQHHFPQLSQQHHSSKSRGRSIQVSLSASGIAPSVGQRVPPLIDTYSDTDAQFQRFSNVMSRMGSSGPDSLNVEVLSTGMPTSITERYQGKGTHSSLTAPMQWPPVHVTKSHPLNFLSNLPQQKQIQRQYNLMDTSKPVVNQGPNKSSVMQGPQLDAVERPGPASTNLLHLPTQQPGLISLNQRNQGQATFLQQQLLHSQEARESFGPSAAAHASHLMAPPLNHGYTPQGHGAAMNTLLSNPIPGISSSVISNTLPPLPPGAPPATFQMGTPSQNAGPILSHPPPGHAFSGLITSLMAQGLISFGKPSSVQDSVGVEFNPDLLKVRHESAITALYADLPRQCTTCGLRFKSQDEHSSHMDWHVTKNRISKNRKQKPSRKWFVSASVWLSTAEALGTDAVPGFLPTEAIVEKKDDEEMAVPADEDQNVCALCGEPFDDFYSDETEEWMYKGAVYLNVPDGSTVGMDRSQLGPIVHAKCRSESTVVSPEDFGRDEGENNENGNQRKRMRS